MYLYWPYKRPTYGIAGTHVLSALKRTTFAKGCSWKKIGHLRTGTSLQRPVSKCLVSGFLAHSPIYLWGG